LFFTRVTPYSSNGPVPPKQPLQKRYPY
jgi:hypothetical protein